MLTPKLFLSISSQLPTPICDIDYSGSFIVSLQCGIFGFERDWE